MGKFNLNNSLDFARATNSFGGSIVSLFTGRGDSAWVIDEGSYQSTINPSNTVIFHVFRTALDYQGSMDRISDSGGRRKAKFTFPYLDGQLTEDLGRLAETFTVDVIIHGNNYLNAFNNFLRILNEPSPGTLTHPVRGKIRCAMESYDILHESKARKALAMNIKFIEHSTSGLSLKNRENKSAPSKLAKLTEVFKKVEDTINKVQGVVFLAQTVKNTIEQQLEAFQNAFGAVTGNMNATFNAGGNIPALLPTQVGGLQGADGGLTSNSTNIALSPADPFVNLPDNLTSQNLLSALAVEQIGKQVTTVREQIATNISTLQDSGNGVGALEFYDDIVNLRIAANDLQDAYEAGKSSSQVQIVRYVTPRVMSVREVAFANRQNPDDGFQIAILNPELDSLNYIPKETELLVAVS